MNISERSFHLYNLIFKTLMVASLSTSLNAFANSEKIYISEDDVVVRNKQILVTFGGESVPMARLATYEHGLYVYEEDLPFGFWVCDNGHIPK